MHLFLIWHISVYQSLSHEEPHLGQVLETPKTLKNLAQVRSVADFLNSISWFLIISMLWHKKDYKLALVWRLDFAEPNDPNGVEHSVPQILELLEGTQNVNLSAKQLKYFCWVISCRCRISLVLSIDDRVMSATADWSHWKIKLSAW